MRSRQTLVARGSIATDGTYFTVFSQGLDSATILVSSKGHIYNYDQESSMSQSSQRIGNIECEVNCVDVLNPKEIDVTSRRVLLACTDGTYRVWNVETCKQELSVKAHSGEVNAARWNKAGTMIASIGVDGCVKLWSSKGTLRSALTTLPIPILDVSWANDQSHIALSTATSLLIYDTRQQKRQANDLKHKAVVLTMEWCPVDATLLVGGEDCRYYLYNEHGRKLHRSDDLSSSVTACGWTRDGSSFMVVTNHHLTQCTADGYPISQVAILAGCVRSMDISSEGMIALSSIDQLTFFEIQDHVEISTIAESCYDRLISALQRHYPQERPIDNISIIRQSKHNFLQCLSNSQSPADNDHLVAIVFSQQCFILREEESVDVEMFEVPVKVMFTKQTRDRFILALSDGNIYVYAYDGAMICQLDNISNKRFCDKQVDIGGKRVILVSSPNEVTAFSSATGNCMGIVAKHRLPIFSVSQCKAEFVDDRTFAFIDNDHALYLSVADELTIKICSYAMDAYWHDDFDILIAVVHQKLVAWHFASSFKNERYAVDQLRATIKENVGDCTEIESLQLSLCTLTCTKGLERDYAYLDPSVIQIHRLLQRQDWSSALKLCRLLESPLLWHCLGVKARIDGVAEVEATAMMALGCVEYINVLV